MINGSRNYLPPGFEPGPNHVIIGIYKQSRTNNIVNKKLCQIVSSKVEE